MDCMGCGGLPAKPQLFWPCLLPGLDSTVYTTFKSSAPLPLLFCEVIKFGKLEVLILMIKNMGLVNVLAQHMDSESYTF